MLNKFFDKFVFVNQLKFKDYNFSLVDVPFVIMPADIIAGLSAKSSIELNKQVYYSVKKSVWKYLAPRFKVDFGLDQDEEILACRENVRRQIAIIKPKVICTLGKFASQTLLNTQTPISGLRGNFYEYEGIKVFQGYYTAFGVKIVPSWGGSLFEFLMPTLLLKEKQLAPEALGLNDERAIKIQQAYAKKKNYPVWGFSPCATPDGSYGGYSEFGVAEMGTKGYKDEGVVTIHASALALDFAPSDAIKNLKKIMEIYPAYGEYGFYDAIDVNTGKVALKYLCLDQAMTFIALDNYLNNGAVRKRFHGDPIAKKAEELLKIENFFE